MARKNHFPLVSLLALGMALPAYAQVEPQQPPAPQGEPQAEPQDQDRDVIVVTAQKREETVQDIAVAVTAITSEAKQEFGVISVTDLTNVTPGLSYTPGNERVTLRGIGRLSNSFGADPGVANYNDGVYTAFAVFAGKDPLLIDRVEVLRGPQGTLYGRNAIGGAINTVSKRPTDELSVDAIMGFGNYDYRRVGAAVSGPITDWLRYRVVGLREFREGIDPNYGENGAKTGWEIDDKYLELQLEGDIGDRFNWWFKTAELSYDKEGPPGGRTATFSSQPYFLGTTPTSANTFNAGGYNPAFPYTGNPAIISFTQGGNRTDNPFATNGEHAYNTNFQSRATLPSYDEYILEAVYSFDNFDVKYTGGYTYYNYVLYSDPDGTPINSVTYNAIAFNPVPIGTPGSSPVTIRPGVTNIYGESRSAFSNEINLISTWDSPLQWIFGVYQYQDNQKQPGQQQYYLDEPLADFVFRPAGVRQPVSGFAANPGRRTQFFSNSSLQHAYGVYGQLDWQMNDQWKFTAGLRWSSDVKQSLEEAYLVLPYVFGVPFLDFTEGQYGALAEGFEADGTAFRHLKGSWEAVTGTLGAEYRPTTDTLAYAKYSRGYKSGGFNNLGFATNPYTDPEFVDSYEVGWKQEWADWNLTTNMAAFYYNYTDAQAPLTQINNFGTPQQTAFTAFINVPEVHTSGFELESTWNPIDPLTIGFTYAYLNAEVASDDLYVDNTKLAADPDRIRSVEGNQLGQSPKHKASLTAAYRFDFEDGSYLFPTLSASWRDIFYDSFFNDAIEKSPSYFNVDARLNWHSSSDHFVVTAWVRNLLDDEQQTSVSGTLSSRDFVLYENPSFAPPRMFGVDFQFHY